MKKYIWLTMFLIWALFLVYLIFFTFWLKTDKPDTNINISTWNVEATKSWENQENDFLMTDSGSVQEQQSEPQDILENTGTQNMEVEEKKEEIIKQENNNELVIGAITLHLTDDDKYDDIFELLWIGDLPKYKIEWKDIYVKKLDSVDYESEKVNIEQLIQKIWGNIANVNWFWDKQLFVNLDPYYKKDSISLVEYKWNVYVMVLPYNKYYEYEKVIKDFLFNK